MSKKCIKCGYPLEDADKYCGKCGVPQPIRCSKCGNLLKEFDRYCRECGSKVINKVKVTADSETIKIGNQEWMAKNMAVTVDRYGKELVLGRDYFYPNGDKTLVAEYGLLYSWRAANCIVPNGWHLPTEEEWWELQLESRNELNAVPAGSYDSDRYYDFGNLAVFWVAADDDIYKAYGRDLYSRYYEEYRIDDGNNPGYSVRCLRD